MPSAISCSLSPHISCIHSRLISDWRRTVSSKFFDTQVSSISTEELVLPRHARCVLSRLRCNEHSLLLGSYLSRIGRIENPSCSACGHSSQDISHLILHCPATDSLRRSLFGDSLSLYDLWSRPWGVARLLGLHGLPPSLGRGRVNNNNNILRQSSKKFKNPLRIIKIRINDNICESQIKAQLLSDVEDLLNRCLRLHDGIMSDALSNPFTDCPP